MTDAPAPAGKPVSDLRLRVLSALVLGVAVLAATWVGGWAFTIVWLIGSSLVVHEFLTMAGARSYVTMLVSLVGALLTGLWAHDMAQGAAGLGAGAPHALLTLLPIACGLLTAMAARSGARLWAFWAAPYASVLAATPVVARGEYIGGLSLVLWLFATVWLTDIAAYFAGRAIGGPKLWPAVSPKKTWSGAIGGTAAGVAAGLAIITVFGRPPLFASWSVFGVAVFTLAASIVSQAGDLGESAMKRRFDVKDSSHLIPGHGGLMDRLDGFWAACVLLGATILLVEGG
ncbi:phosphatidate cytidylyltransferase [Terrarubrum flagellatum]|uniref:phosphatidate cytidylyltransferase n=1 Tax=Terrirubrum flagellatum TaxID=2895980 RepID=UPI0031451A79